METIIDTKFGRYCFPGLISDVEVEMIRDFEYCSLTALRFEQYLEASGFEFYYEFPDNIDDMFLWE